MSAIEVVRLLGVATVQDRGRPGWMHMGVPPGGALVPPLLARANGAVGNGNGDDAAGIELVGGMEVRAHGEGVVLATEEGDARPLGDGETWRIDGRPGLRVRYVAVRGGIDVPVVLGGRGTLLTAGFGGLEGRALRKGDILRVAEERRRPEPVASWVEEEAQALRMAPDVRAIRVRPGPDAHRFAADALRTLESAPFALQPASDRTGTRLSGPRIERLGADGDVSAPLVAGAIEVPASGDPIVLGPDHPTTGGYPVLAVVLRADLPRFHACPLGWGPRSRVAFRVA